jgi:predicted GTPase
LEEENMSKTSQTTSGTPTAGDVVIAVMGVTGVGKSTFINYFSDGEAVVGHSLEACKLTIDKKATIGIDASYRY